ncbi:MAG: hypothetical protein LAP38_07305 [Acidobacteriia bacterium]|nr:hypothetical protein [Terriglobia bacterium]
MPTEQATVTRRLEPEAVCCQLAVEPPLTDAPAWFGPTASSNTCPVLATMGAVYIPAEEMVPPVADQVTALLLVPLTAAVNCCIPPALTVVEPGVTLTLTGEGAAALIVNVTAVENMPDRESHSATLTLPALATKFDGTTAWACVSDTSVVVSRTPFHVILSLPLKYEPETVRVKPPEPAGTALGEIDVMDGKL